jgi:hypothetical protein
MTKAQRTLVVKIGERKVMTNPTPPNSARANGQFWSLPIAGLMSSHPCRDDPFSLGAQSPRGNKLARVTAHSADTVDVAQ